MKYLNAHELSGVAAVGATPFMTQLLLIGIVPIDMAKVHAYKRYQLKENPANLLGWILHLTKLPPKMADAIYLEFLYGGIKNRLVVGTIALLLAAIFMPLAWTSGSIAFWWVAMFALCAGTIGIIAGTLLPAAVYLELIPHTLEALFPAFWSVQAIGGQALPAKPWEMYQAIRSQMPHVRFEIEKLIQDKIVIDPILWVVDPDTHERVAVTIWDEEDNEVVL